VNNILLKISSLVILLGVTCASAEMQKPSMATTLSVDEAVQIAVAANPQVLSAKAQYLSALHQIDQAYTPQDPEFNYSNNQSPNGLFHPYSISRGISASLQFPGKGWLQGDEARRTAEIAKLTYQAAVRDTRAGAETTYYQTLLDSASVDIAAENAASIGQVMEVARVAYTANQVTESDLISAQFQLSQASQTVWVDQVSEANDEAGLNQILGRKPQNPLELTSQMELEPLEL
jgi:outer membrane protein TolC